MVTRDEVEAEATDLFLNIGISEEVARYWQF